MAFISSMNKELPRRREQCIKAHSQSAARRQQDVQMPQRWA